VRSPAKLRGALSGGGHLWPTIRWHYIETPEITPTSAAPSIIAQVVPWRSHLEVQQAGLLEAIARQT